MDNAFEVKKQNDILAKVTTDGEIVDSNGHVLSEKPKAYKINQSVNFTSSTTLTKVHEFVMPQTGYLFACFYMAYINNIPKEIVLSTRESVDQNYRIFARSGENCTAANISGLRLAQGDKIYVYAAYGGVGNNTIGINGMVLS